jgi:uncharacterized surface protein with fasciclin (FAS1) repeats
MSTPTTISQLASSLTDLSTLVTALKAADLVDTLDGTDMFTVFAPTNQAFEKVPTETLQSLLMPENKSKLSSILLYHVVSGRYGSSSLSDGMMLKTVQGEELTVHISESGVSIMDAAGNSANVITADADASNGFVHIIDSVLMPS